jgi:alanine dehydrogenase
MRLPTPATRRGAHYLEIAQGGRGLLLGGVAGVAPAKVVVLGAGVAGINAVHAAIGLEAAVALLDINVDRLYAVKQQFGSAIKTLYSTRTAIEEQLLSADRKRCPAPTWFIDLRSTILRGYEARSF